MRSKNCSSLARALRRGAPPARAALVLGAVLAITGCATEPEITTAPAAAGGICKPWGCGENAPVMDLESFHELHADGGSQPNPDGLYIKAVHKAGTSYKLGLHGLNLVALDAQGLIALQHGALTGLIFEVKSVVDPTVWYDIEVKQVSPTGATFWLGPASSVETYRLAFGGHGQPTRRPLCDHPSTNSMGQQLPMMNFYDVLVFGGERYDAAAKTIVASGPSTDGWINFGCAGGVLAKLVLNRHAVAAHTPTFVTTLKQRQAMLKMFSADYCGTGQAFTHTGEPLTWRDAAGNVPAFSAVPGTHEAWWTPYGAACLEVPRLDVTTEPYWGVDLENDIAAACGGTAPPLCSAMPYWPAIFGDAQFISANPLGS